MASRPFTPVAATAFGRVPLYDVPIMPTLPVVQYALTSLPSPSTAVVRPFSQSITALMPSVSLRPPLVGQPSEPPVPSDSAWTTAKPRGTQVEMSELLITPGFGPTLRVVSEV